MSTTSTCLDASSSHLFIYFPPSLLRLHRHMHECHYWWCVYHCLVKIAGCASLLSTLHHNEVSCKFGGQTRWFANCVNYVLLLVLGITERDCHHTQELGLTFLGWKLLKPPTLQCHLTTLTNLPNVFKLVNQTIIQNNKSWIMVFPRFCWYEKVVIQEAPCWAWENGAHQQ